ncbi:pilus assembly protein [Bradyrhizobium sp.]|uniref:TadE/TadG family type IV pilus assembly protein n=1 Tax=Bradyrhizobium sp. TaxID=376 RepID=UPI002DF98824|nr:pilus assembly protein [Bradyrhizobium sp.]
MSSASLRHQVRGAATRFIRADEGNIAVLFGIALLPILSFIGAAVDYTRANSARSSMQAALDSTALMLSKDLSEGAITPSQVNTKASSYFTALYTNPDAKSVAVTANYTASSSIGSTIQVNGSGAVTTDFLKVAGFPTINFNGTSTTAWGNVRMRVAMALDNTGSMAEDGKMPAMQSAAKALVDQLSGFAKTAGDIYISIIPFAKDVNVGASNYNQSWIDWTDWDAANGADECTKYKKNGNCKTSVWVPDDHDTWTGCVTDRDQDYDTKNTAPTSSATRFPAEEYVSYGEKFCKPGNNPYLQPIMPLSYDWSAIKTLIGNMQPTGNTNQGIGMAWAWMTLTQSAPFNAPAKDPNYTYKDAIVLLSDGLNTQNRWYGNAAQIDARQKILCDNAKAAGVTIYTVHVNTGSPPDPVSSVLQYCASGSQNFYVVTTASQTATVFNSIGTSLSKLRVAK